jgi:P27 family predicted phage terminase small subunit
MKATTPDHLKDAGRALWTRVMDEFAIDDGAGQALLCAACEALDRMREAQAALAADGMTVTDRYGTKKTHPAIAVERDSRNGMLAALRQLNLDLAPTTARTGNPFGVKR